MGNASEIPGLKDRVELMEMMEWFVEYATIREEEYHVKVEFEDVRVWHETMTFIVTSSEKCCSLKGRAATKTGQFASNLLLFRGSDQMGYSLNCFNCQVSNK